MPDFTAIAKQANQILLPLIGIALVLGLIYVVVVTLALGGESKAYTFLAFVFVIAVVGGFLAGVQADYPFVISLVRIVGFAGSGFMLKFAIFGGSFAPAVSTGLSVAGTVVTLVPRVYVLGSAAVMLAGSLYVFEWTRLGYLIGLCFVVSLLWMSGTALLLGDGFSEVLLPDTTPAPDPPEAQPR
jgi:hypothetical protein